MKLGQEEGTVEKIGLPMAKVTNRSIIDFSLRAIFTAIAYRFTSLSYNCGRVVHGFWWYLAQWPLRSSNEEIQRENLWNFDLSIFSQCKLFSYLMCHASNFGYFSLKMWFPRFLMTRNPTVQLLLVQNLEKIDFRWSQHQKMAITFLLPNRRRKWMAPLERAWFSAYSSIPLVKS